MFCIIVLYSKGVFDSDWDGEGEGNSAVALILGFLVDGVVDIGDDSEALGRWDKSDKLE